VRLCCAAGLEWRLADEHGVQHHAQRPAGWKHGHKGEAGRQLVSPQTAMHSWRWRSSNQRRASGVQTAVAINSGVQAQCMQHDCQYALPRTASGLSCKAQQLLLAWRPMVQDTYHTSTSAPCPGLGRCSTSGAM
jgi:hypothetical protein